MQCELCSSSIGVGTNDDGVWNAALCESCHQRGDWRARLEKRWVREAILETGGEIEFGGMRGRYERSSWSVSFALDVVPRAVLETKDAMGLYRELYRWHRDASVAYPSHQREWIRSLVVGSWHFDSFCGDDAAVSMLVSHDGTTGIIVPLGHVEKEIRESQMAEFLERTGITVHAWPGANGFRWAQELVGGVCVGAGGDRSAVFQLPACKVEVPNHIVNRRDEAALRFLIGKVLEKSA